MPRAPRIEFEGAVYHVMARGNRREPIVFDDKDRELFVATFGEAATKTGWEVFAWVLMDNHYHAVFRTPEPNLVKGMAWLQNAYTRRLNARRSLWGHLFGGRYRSVLVENGEHGGAYWRDYLRTVVDYVHLNPGRAGLIGGRTDSLRDYRWSSIAQGYALAPSKRPNWMAVGEGLDLHGYRDTVHGRRKFVERLDSWIEDEGNHLKIDNVPVQERLRRGWFWGTETFKESVMQNYEKSRRSNRTYRSSETERSYGEKRAKEILEAGAEHYGLGSDELSAKRKGDLRRVSVAWAIDRKTTMDQAWIAEALDMKSAENVSQQVRRFSAIDPRKLPKRVREWRNSIFVD